MKRWIHSLVGGVLVIGLGLSLAVVLPGCCRQESPSAGNNTSGSTGAPCSPGATSESGTVATCDGKGKVALPEGAKGRARTGVLMDQWRRDHADSRWVEEEKAAHAFKPPADNSDILKGGQGKGHAYGDYTEADLRVWTRETEKMVAEGSRIFHSGDLLGSTVGVSCDMCHPHASNTHPETYPKFQTQLGRVVLLRDMINWCIENPVRGKKFAADSAEMRALEAYIMAQRKGVEMNYGKQ
jgi:thiosulfate dehydrogenase